MSKADSSEKYGRWRDLDPRRHCTVCSKAGLRWDNATRLCAGCFRQLPQVAKASRSTEAKVVLQGFARTMVDRPGLACAALDAAAVSARLGDRFRIAPVAAGTDDSLGLTGLRLPAVSGRSGEPQVEFEASTRLRPRRDAPDNSPAVTSAYPSASAPTRSRSPTSSVATATSPRCRRCSPGCRCRRA